MSSQLYQFLRRQAGRPGFDQSSDQFTIGLSRFEMGQQYNRESSSAQFLLFVTGIQQCVTESGEKCVQCVCVCVCVCVCCVCGVCVCVCTSETGRMRHPEGGRGGREGASSHSSLRENRWKHRQLVEKLRRKHTQYTTVFVVSGEVTVFECSAGSKEDCITHVTVVRETHNVHIEHPAQLVLGHTQSLHIHTLRTA